MFGRYKKNQRIFGHASQIYHEIKGSPKGIFIRELWEDNKKKEESPKKNMHEEQAQVKYIEVAAKANQSIRMKLEKALNKLRKGSKILSYRIRPTVTLLKVDPKNIDDVVQILEKNGFSDYGVYDKPFEK